MICKNCPFCNCYEDYYYDDYIQLHTTDYYYYCSLDDREHNAYDECYFPETIMEKGI